MIVGNHPLQITVAATTKPYEPKVWLQGLKGGGAEVAVSIGNAYVAYRLDRDEVLAVAAWLTVNAGAEDR